MSKTTQIKQESVTVQQIAPKFVSQLKDTSVNLEGQHPHFECRLEPQNDPNMKVEWIHNGKSCLLPVAFKPIMIFDMWQWTLWM